MFSSLYSSISFISALLALSLLPWFIRFRNVAGLTITIWLFAVNFLYGVNAAVFTGDALLRGPVYCDIVTKLLLGMQMAVPTAMLCYTLSIHDWMHRPKYRNVDDKCFAHRAYFHAALCVLLPIVYMGLHVAVQDHRFDIVEDVGCIPASAPTLGNWSVVWMMLVIPFILSLYPGIEVFMYAWVAHRRFYSEHMTSWELVDSELMFTKAPFGIIRIVRLSAMIVIVMLWTFSTMIYAFVNTIIGLSFSYNHDFSRINVFSSLSTAPLSVHALQLFLWSGPFYSFLFFAASIDKDVLYTYPLLFKKYILRHPVGMRPDPCKGIDLTTLTPIPVRKRIHRRVMRKSRQYDPPLSILDYDIPLPPRPDPGFRTTAPLPSLPTPPKLAQTAHRSKRIYVNTKAKARRISQFLSASPKKSRSRGFHEAMRQHAMTYIDKEFPISTIPEYPPPIATPTFRIGGGYIPLEREGHIA